MQYTYEYPKPSVTVDILLIMNNKILLIKRKNEPFKNCWAFPGGFVNEYENLESAAARELNEETSLSINNLQQFKAYGDKFRDPRGWTISIVFFKILSNNNLQINAQDDACDIDWFDFLNPPKLAFDHQKILKDFIIFKNLGKHFE